ncbi:hypothetical protein CBS133816_6032 [Aspergillus niger]|nr:hypothetical protein CBS133816_6032 [Aspergillus niger]
MSLNRALIFKKVPTGSLPVPGEDLATEPVTQCDLNSAPANGILVQSLYASFDPYMRAGFIVADAEFGPAYFMEHQANVQRWIKDGSIKCLFHETVGVENAAEGLVGIFEGKNKGKALLKF